jgi:hypothetical protein
MYYVIRYKFICQKKGGEKFCFVDQLNQGSGYFFHGKMPGCCLPSLTAATALHFTAGYLKLSLQHFLSGNSPLPIRSTGAIILS